MSAYEIVVSGQLNLKGKALDVRTGRVKKKKKHSHHHDRRWKFWNINWSYWRYNGSWQAWGWTFIHLLTMTTSCQLIEGISIRGRKLRCGGWQRLQINDMVAKSRNSISIWQISVSIPRVVAFCLSRFLMPFETPIPSLCKAYKGWEAWPGSQEF